MSSHPFRREENLTEISDVNVVPLADVSLVLLIILLLLTPMMTQSMLHVRTAAKTQEPSSSVGTLEPLSEVRKPPELVLMVDLGPGGIAIGDTLFSTRADMVAYLKIELPRREDRKVFLAPHPDVTHGQVVATLESIQAAGASAVSLVQTIEDEGSL